MTAIALTKGVDREALLRDVEKRICEESLHAFIKRAWKIVEPGQTFVDNWHIEFICDHLMAITDEHILENGKPYNRLLANVPPGTMKSLVTNVFWPAWEWGPCNKPHLRYICAAHSQNLAIRDSTKMRRLVLSDWYQSHWGDRVQLTGDQNAKTKFENTATGFREAIAAGSITGSRGDRVLIDDPHSVEGANSDAMRASTLEWFTEAVPTRLNNPRESAIVVIMQRLHEEDVSGVILERKGFAGTYDHICYDQDTEILTKNGWVKFPNLQDRIEVLGVSPDGLFARWEIPTSYVRNKYSGEMIHYKSQTTDLMVTKDHRMIYCDPNDMHCGKADKWRVRYAKDMPSEFYLPQVVDWKGDYDKVSFGGELWEPKSFAEFMGWYLSEGCASVKRCTVRIIQNSDGKHVPDIERVLSASPFKWKKVRHNDRSNCWIIWSKPLAEALSPLGDSHKKYAPDILKNLPPDCLRAFIIAYAKGDGHFAVRNSLKITISTASKRMCDDIQECAVKAGWASSRTEKFQEGGRIFNGYVLPSILVHKIYIRASKAVGCERKIASRIRKIHTKHVKYDGFVYCVSVPSTGIVVRRNGRVSISGNCLPMRFEAWRKDTPTWLGYTDPREEEGELLFPARFPEDVVDDLEGKLGPYATAGQHQQAPTPRGGGVIKDAWWQLYSDAEFPALEYVIASLDTAYSTKAEERGDYSAITIWGVFQGDASKVSTRSVDRYGKSYDAPPAIVSSDLTAVPRLILMHAWAERLDLHSLIEKVVRDCRTFKVDKILIENKAAGHSVAQELRRLFGYEDFAVHLYDPKSLDKLSRLYSVQHIFAEGMVYAPDKHWAEEVIRQVSSFPRGKHDDLVDTVSMALRHLRDLGLLTRSPERMAEIDRSKQFEGRPPPPLYGI